MPQSEPSIHRRQSRRWILPVLVALGLCAGPGLATRYVATTGSDTSNDCTVSASPCATLQHAVDEATAGEEVRVAAGSYSGSQVVTVTRLTTDYDYKQVVFIDKALTLRGGYLVSDWNSYDPVANSTVIDALGDGRPITIVDTLGEVVGIGGFTLTGGDYTGLGNPAGLTNHVCRSRELEDCGGGLYVFNSAFELVDSIVSGNVASSVEGDGGGIYLWWAWTSTIENTTVAGNSAVYGGGGLYVTEQNFPLTIRDSTFDGNTGSYGGGVCLSSNIEALIRIEDSALVGNRAETDDGGGLYVNMTQNGRILELDRVAVEDNLAWAQGKGVYVTAAGPYVPEAQLVNVLFSGNGRVDGSPEASQDAVLAVTSSFTSLEATLAHVTAADNLVGSFLYSQPDTDASKYAQVTAANLLLTGFENGFAAEEVGSGEVTIEHTNTLFYDVANEHLTVAGTPTFTAVDPVFGDPLLDAGYRLQSGSAAIDAGVEVGVVADIDNEYRPQGVAPDIGADEYYQLIAPSSLNLSGPSTAVANTVAQFLAEVGPIDATRPITYTWEATDLDPIVHVGGPSDTVDLTWTTTGTKTVQVTATNPQGTIGESTSVTVIAEPVLGITKTGPAEALSGSEITYTITVENTGEAAATSLVITDQVPTDATFVEALDGGSHDAGTVTWNHPSLGSGVSATFRFVVTATETIVNDTYEVNAAGGYGAVGTEAVTTVFGSPVLAITKSGPAAASPGESITYELKVSNTGNIAAESLEVSDTVPTGATWISGGTLDAGVVRWQAASLAAGDEALFGFTVQAADTITNDTYSVTAAGGFDAVGTTVVTTVIGSGTRYVATSGSDPLNDCTDSASPCATLQWAVDVAATAEEIRVAMGTYSGSQLVTVSRSATDYDYKQVVFIDKALTLRGGYTETNWDTSEPETNVTAIDALGDGRPVTIVDTASDVVELGGFVLTGGDYTSLGNPTALVNHVCRGQGDEDCGGGLYVFNSSFRLVDSVINGNVASTVAGDGGGLYLWSARTGTIENTTVAGNSSLYGGGGLYATDLGSPLTIRDSSFVGNTAAYGGGVCLSSNIDFLVRFEDSQLSANTAQSGRGGGLYANLTSNGSILELERVAVEDNQAWDQGKGVFVGAAGPVTPSLQLVNVLFSGNGRVDGSPEASQDAVLAVAPAFTSLEATLAHVTAAGNPVGSFLYSRPDTDPGRTVQVTAANLLLSGFENGFAAEEVGAGEVTIEHSNTLFYEVANQHLTVGGTPTFTAVDPVFGDPLLDAGYRLQAGSAAIDSGADAGVPFDIDHGLRPFGAAPDIGSDEFGAIFADGFESADTAAWPFSRQ